MSVSERASGPGKNMFFSLSIFELLKELCHRI